MTTSLLTAVITGVSIFILGQYVLKFVLDPIVELRRTLGEICGTLSVFENVLSVPTRYDSAQKAAIYQGLEKLSAQLYACLMALPFYGLFRTPFFLPRKEVAFDIAERLHSMVGLSKSGAKDTLEKNWLLTIELFELLNAPLPERLRQDKQELREAISAKKQV